MGQTELPTLLAQAEQATGVYQQGVRKRPALEGNSLHNPNSVKNDTIIISQLLQSVSVGESEKVEIEGR